MPTAGFWDSKDLINWTNQRLGTLSSDPKIMAWGPEAIYDSANGNFFKISRQDVIHRCSNLLRCFRLLVKIVFSNY